MLKRIYVEKKPGFDIEAQQLMAELHDILGIESLDGLRILNRYDVELEGDDSESLFEQSVNSVFSEPQADLTFASLDEALLANASNEGDESVFAVEYLPGQFDQRADSASQCIQIISQGVKPDVKSSTVYVLHGTLSDSDVAQVKSYLINPVEAREASLDPVDSIAQDFEIPEDVEILDGFRELNNEQLKQFISDRGLAMDLADIEFLQGYFREIDRDPTITEVKVIDTYWSDHCRHTTFETRLDDIQIDDDQVAQAFDVYMDLRHELGRDEKPVTLMDMGTIGAKALAAAGELTGLDESEEINACTVKVKVDVRGEEQDWLYLFKNETHNHPTEIEPFGGAATCLGGAIRDPLSGRAYVYQAMRLTGAADPRTPIEDTIKGKLPQRKIVTTAADGYSSYGNQIGLATGQVNEVYHPGYAAKRMEIGAVVGATPASDVRRETPAPGDVIVLLGGRTGRDGIGGATGSSKAHSSSSLDTCGAEVQKGNPPVERKIQRLFRNSEACRMIKRCNDFGAGGVSVAIGELADGLEVFLDKVPKKYEGLDGTELAISESQERMAVALAPEDVDHFIALARAESLEATPVAVVTEEPYVRMYWRGKTIVDISREFLASNGAPKSASVIIGELNEVPMYSQNTEDVSLESVLLNAVTDINNASNKGLAERFDSTIGSATVLMPFGGQNQLTPAQAMVAKLPVLGGNTTTVSGMSWGFNPYLSATNPFSGAYIAVLESIAKLIATGFERSKMYLTFQEYFEKLGDDPVRWGQPVSAVLGALLAQVSFGVGAIGGKDSMSGSFEDLDVPPTLVSFATATGSIDRITSPEFKRAGSKVVWAAPLSDMPIDITATFDGVSALIGARKVSAAYTVGYAGLCSALFNMCVGNSIGIDLDDVTIDDLTMLNYGTFVLELAEGEDSESVISFLKKELGEHIVSDKRVEASEEEGSFEIIPIGTTISEFVMALDDEKVGLSAIQKSWEDTLAGVFPYKDADECTDAPSIPEIDYVGGCGTTYHGVAIAKPRVIIPVFPGTNCEYDTLAAFERAGAIVETQIINNLEPSAVRESIKLLAQNIANSQIVMIPGGFSGGDEPDGSAKFITAAFRAPEVTDAVRDLLQNRDGLMLGICNGFQALVKLGLVPYGDIVDAKDGGPTLTFNNIGRHQSRIVNTRVGSNLSPWLSECEVGEIYGVAISHGEGRFVASDELLKQMADNGQIATQYVDAQGAPSMSLDANPNGSVWAIEGITSPDGRVFGRMGHSERSGSGLYKNIPGNLYQPIFESGVNYFK